MSSNRTKKRAALAKMRRGSGGRLDTMSDEDDEKDDEIYDYLEENEYQDLVNRRRQQQDFVVDDDGIGYHDDGEERFGDEGNDEDGKKSKKRSSTASLTTKALKKARKVQQAKASVTQASEAGGNTSSMWNFVNKMKAPPARASANKAAAKSTKTAVKDVDALLDQLDEDVAPLKRSKKNSRKKMESSRRRVSIRPARTVPSSPADDAMYDDNDDCSPFDNEDEPAPTEANETVELASDSVPSDQTTAGADGESGGKEENMEGQPQEKAPAVQPRRRVARPKLGQVSQALQKKQEALQRKTEDEVSGAQTSLAPLVDTTSASFQPHIVDEAPATTTSATKYPLADLLTKPDDAEPYLDMFWTDLSEKNGDIMVFGKVAVPGSSQFVSASVLVQGTVRNLFVLPKPGASLQDVHAEVNDLLQSSVLPRTSGASWAGKPVQRSYAFGDTSVPRESTSYLKVVYSTRYPAPSPEVCKAGGKHFSQILNAQASPTESFLIKRGLKGPGWIRMHSPIPTKANISWCASECQLDSPKQLKVVTEARPAPPLVTVSLKIKTISNPVTHQSEVVSVSAVGHSNFQLETSNETNSKYAMQLSLIRPVSSGKMAAVFPRDMGAQVASKFPTLKTQPNERALLSCLIATVSQWDPDFWIGHSAWNYELDVILARCSALKINTWSKLGRRRRVGIPKVSSQVSRDWAIADALSGRLVCDTYLSSKELLRETTYSLTHLAATQLHCKRQEIQPSDIPRWFDSGATICQLALSTLFDAQLVQRLAFKLQILPLTKQLTNIAGNKWSQTLKSNRAVRTEFLLLHEFHRCKYLPPEKQKKSVTQNKAKYAGGLVLEPKKGLYDSFILLLDFNSLYPSIIQEYNLCFTTMDWAPFSVLANEGSTELPSIPDTSNERGVLPRVIQTLVERRRTVKKLLKSESNPQKKDELDIRQQALKLTANSMYGCLGFSNSRFYAQPIAALVTAMGRETLQRTVDVAQQKVGLDVIYGDTDSIMINTRMNDEADLPKVKELGGKVKREVNRLYKTLELEIDGIFRSMLLLKKKKYAAKTIEEGPNGEIRYGQELKGLDLVRRDWCIQSKETGRYVTEQILSGEDTELVLQNIHQHMEDLAKKMRNNELPLKKFTITKGLSKHPSEYPDAKSQPHVQVAKRMLQNSQSVNHGDHIPYIITEEQASEGPDPPKSATAADRARHPDEISRSNGKLKPDIEWYLTQQILPPIARLCDPIEGTSQQILAEKLGLDAARYNQIIRANGDVDADDLIDYTPASTLSDMERFKEAEKFHLYCYGCGVESEFPGVFHVRTDTETGNQMVVSGMQCTNPDCVNPRNWGHSSHFEFFARVSNNLNVYARNLQTKYYGGLVRCDEPGCGLETRQLSVAGGVCLRRGCHGKMGSVTSERAVYNHLKYLESLFNTDHASNQLVRKKLYGTKSDILKSISKHDKNTFDELHRDANHMLGQCAFNWISPTFWSALFAGGGAKQ